MPTPSTCPRGTATRPRPRRPAWATPRGTILSERGCDGDPATESLVVLSRTANSGATCFWHPLVARRPKCNVHGFYRLVSCALVSSGRCCGVVCGGVVWCGVVWWTEDAVTRRQWPGCLPTGTGKREGCVYSARAVYKCVVIGGKRGGVGETWMSPSWRQLSSQKFPLYSLSLRLLVQA